MHRDIVNIYCFQFWFSRSYGVEAPINFDKTRLEGLVAEYVNWNVNVPTEQLPEEGNQCVIKPGDVNLLLRSFQQRNGHPNMRSQERHIIVISLLRWMV